MRSEEVRAAAERIRRALQGRCDLDEGATVTVVTGLSGEEVLAAFGADPGRAPVPRDELAEAGAAVSLLEVPGGVVAIEDCGFEGASEPVLHRASARGRAAATFWHPAGDRAFEVGRGGVVHEVVASFELGELVDDSEVAAAFAGVPLDERHREGGVAGGARDHRGRAVHRRAARRPCCRRARPRAPRAAAPAPAAPGGSAAPALAGPRRRPALRRGDRSGERRPPAAVHRVPDPPAPRRRGPAPPPGPAGDARHAGTARGRRPRRPRLRRAFHSPLGGPGQDTGSRTLQVLYQALNPDPRVAALAAASAASKALPAASRAHLPVAALATIESIVERAAASGAAVERVERGGVQ